MRTKVTDDNLKSAFRFFRADGFEPVLIKGWAAAKEYPERYLRIFSDIDLCVSPDVFEKCRELISRTEIERLNIDLHCGLRHLDTAQWERLFQNSKLELLDEIPIRVLRVEDHLRVLCVHWLTDGGAYRDRLLDIFYLLRNNADNFDWDYCFEAVTRNRRDWIIKTIAVVHQHYKLDTLKLPFAEELNSVPEWFMKALQREWTSETKLTDIHSLVGNRREFWKQVKKRLRPNPIQATVFMDGRFDRTPRLYYQVGSFFLRLKSSMKKTNYLLKHKLRRKFYKNV